MGRVETSEVTLFSWRHLAFVTPLLCLHLACAFVFVVGVSRVAVAAFALTAVAQIFGITTGYHRLLTHQSFKTTRVFQFLLAMLGVLAAQNGPLWWVSHHRHHHQHADKDGDAHSPRVSFFWGHMGWLFSTKCLLIRRHLVADLERLAEMRLLEKYYYVVVIAYGLVMYAAGEIWQRVDPAAGVTGAQLLVWGSIVSTVFAYHAIWSANSIGHRFGSRRFPTRDDSRNNWLVSLITLGDGWHHNHHYCPYSARHGFRWWEIDVNYWILRVLEALGLVWGLKLPPKRVYSYNQ
jgi:stearoyl-CoA desaturase (Delta-9 desaturase)